MKDGGHGEEADEDCAVDDRRRIFVRVGRGPDQGVRAPQCDRNRELEVYRTTYYISNFHLVKM